jgi:hypothetical protein
VIPPELSGGFLLGDFAFHSAEGRAPTLVFAGGLKEPLAMVTTLSDQCLHRSTFGYVVGRSSRSDNVLTLLYI